MSLLERTSAPLRVGFDGRILMYYEMRGFARYTVELFRAIKEIAGDAVKLFSFSPEPIALPFLKILNIEQAVFGASREILWEQLGLPRQLRNYGIDIYHATANRGLPYWRTSKYVLTCHDVIDRMPEWNRKDSWRTRWRKTYSDFAGAHSADRIVTVSEYSRRDMCRSSGIKAKKVSVVHNAAGPQFFDSRSLDDIRRVKQKYGLPDRYFLYVGGFDIRKNVAALVEAFAGLSESASSLVLAGEQKWDFEPVSRLIEKLNVSDRVNCPGTIAEDDLPALYSAALAYVYPSLYEGFGLQLVEAMASGIPVLASQTTSLPEILGDAGLLFDPRDPASISGQMERVERDGELRASMIARGLLRARTFSWRATAEQTLSVYSEVLGESKERAMPLPLAQEQRG